MGIALKEDQTPVLTAAQVDGNWKSLFGAPTLRMISGDTITVTGAGVYRVVPQTGTADQVTAIAGAQREGDEVTFLNNTAGHTITYVNGGSLHLTANFVMDNIYSTLTLMHVGGNIFVEKHRSYNT